MTSLAEKRPQAETGSLDRLRSIAFAGTYVWSLPAHEDAELPADLLGTTSSSR